MERAKDFGSRFAGEVFIMRSGGSYLLVCMELYLGDIMKVIYLSQLPDLTFFIPFFNLFASLSPISSL